MNKLVKTLNAVLLSLFTLGIAIPTLLLLALSFVLVRPFSLPLYRKIVVHIAGSAFLIASFVLKKWSKMKIKVIGDRYPIDSSCLIIANHSARTDWLTTIAWLSQGFPYPGNVKFVATGDIKKIPIFGWLLQMIEFVFISKKWVQEGEKIKKEIESLGEFQDNTGYPLALILFPEGQIFETYKVKKSHEYATKNDLPLLDNLLLPRLRGFREIVPILRGKIDYIVDTTIVFRPEKAKILDVLAGSETSTVEFHTKKHDIDSIPENPDELDSWLLETWKEKDAFIESITSSNANEEDSSECYYIEPKHVFSRLIILFSLFIIGIAFIFHLASFIKHGEIDLLAVILLIFFSASIMIWRTIFPAKHLKRARAAAYGSVRNEQSA